MSVSEQRIPEGFVQSEVGLIPEDWNVYRLPEVVWYQEGPGLRKWQFKAKGLKVINVTNLQQNGFLDLDRTDRHISWDEYEKTYKHFACDEGDLVIASSGNSYCKSSIVRKRDLPLLMNTSVIRFKPVGDFSKGFMDVYLKSQYFKDQIDLLITGGAQPNFGPAHLDKIKIPAPSNPEEQTAIANALSDVDALLTELEELIAKKQAIKTATMQQLLTGKTRLPQFATYTEGTLEGKSKGTKPSELGKIPEDWDVLPLRSCLENEKIPSGLYKDKNMYGNGTPIIKLGDVFGNDYFKPERAQKVIATKNEISAYKVKIGDLIIALASVKLEGVGKVMLVDNLISDTLFDHNVALMRFTKNFNPTFMSYMLRGNYVRSLIASRATQVGTTFLKTSTILEFEVPLPSYNEQSAIASILSDMDNEIQTLEQRLAKTRHIKQGLMQELLTGRTRLPF